MVMQPVTSTNVQAVGYDSASRTLRVAFRNGGVYDYYDVDYALFEQMLLPYPWRRLGLRVKRHKCRKVAAA